SFTIHCKSGAKRRYIIRHLQTSSGSIISNN
ncbi:hypothetical protein ACN38_g12073, partial [Penicillium nordicum]